MGRLQLAIILNYVLLGLLCLGVTLSAWHRFLAPDWATMSDVRLKYNLFGFVLVVFSVTVGLGVYYRKEWARIFSVTLNFIALFIQGGIRLYAVIMYPELSLASLFSWEALLISILALLNIVLLTRPAFRTYYLDPQPR